MEDAPFDKMEIEGEEERDGGKDDSQEVSAQEETKLVMGASDVAITPSSSSIAAGDGAPPTQSDGSLLVFWFDACEGGGCLRLPSLCEFFVFDTIS